MRWRAELSDEAQEQLERFPRNVRDRISRAIDELEASDDSQWSNIKALQGPEWKGRLRKRVGPYRIIFRKFPWAASATVELLKREKVPFLFVLNQVKANAGITGQAAAEREQTISEFMLACFHAFMKTQRGVQ
jgi:mRNA-degrading endonuclease RelE of RelBE toxin-antitoxin system